MESGLKQRLVGAAVLVALAVIFLPMLVKGPMPDSGVSDVPLKMPDAPPGDYQTRDLPLVVPDAATAAGGAVGMASAPRQDGALPIVDTASAAPAAADAPAPADDAAIMLPAATAGGDYAVDFGAYDSSANAETVIARLRGASLPAYRETAEVDGRQAWRVRVGPYATRARAEIARVAASRLDARARVVALDAATAAPASTAQPLAAATAPVTASALPHVPAKPPTATTKPTPKPVAAVPPAPPPVQNKPTAAAGVGFAVQLGAFGNAADAGAMRERLRAAGFSAFTEAVGTDKGPLTRVRVGPVLSRADAEQLKAQVKSKTGIDGIVRPHP